MATPIKYECDWKHLTGTFFQITDQWLRARLQHLHSYCTGDIKNNAWVTVNTDFWSWVGWFSNDFHEWWSHEWKSLANHLTSDQKIVIHGNEDIILFLTRYFYILNTPFRYKQLSVAHFANVARDGLFWLNIVTSSQLICDVTRTRGTGIVTSYSSIVLARANWRKGDLH